MRLLHIITSIDPRDGGPVETSRVRAIELGRFGWTQEVVCGDEPDSPHVLSYPGTVHALGSKQVRGLLSAYQPIPGLTAWLRANLCRYDAVVVSGLWSHIAQAAWQALRHSDVPYYVFTHGMLDPWFRQAKPVKHAMKQLLWLSHVGKLMRGAQAVLFTTDEERRLAERAFWPYRLNPRVVEYGTADVSGNASSQVAAFRASVPGLENKPFLLFLSRIHPKKGCDLLIEGFGAAAAREQDLHLVIGGPDGDNLRPTLLSRASELGFADRIHFPGMLSGDEKWGAFRACEALALISHQENFGIAVAEAMACGKPVLISNKVNIWRDVVSDGAGLADTDTAGGAARLLDRFIRLSPLERARMGRSARASFLRHYRSDRVVESFARMLAGDLPRLQEAA